MLKKNLRQRVMVKGPKGDARQKSAVVNIFVKNDDMDELRKDLIRLWEEA